MREAGEEVSALAAVLLDKLQDVVPRATEFLPSGRAACRALGAGRLMPRAISPPRAVEESPGVGTVEALRRLADQIPFIPDGEIPGVIAEAARLQALLSLALTTRLQAELRSALEGAPKPTPPLPPAAEHEQLVDAPEAARRLDVTEDWIRRHTDELPFTVRLGRKVRFRVAGIDRYLRAAEFR